MIIVKADGKKPPIPIKNPTAYLTGWGFYFDDLQSGDARFFRFSRNRFDDGLDHRFLFAGGDSGGGACFAGGGWRDRREDNRPRAALGIIRNSFFAFLHFARLGARNRELAAHKGLVMEYFHAADRVIHVQHLHEAVAFRAMGRAVVNDFDAADRADAFEQFLKVLLGDIVGEVAYIDAGGLDRRRIAAARALGIASALTFAGPGRTVSRAGIAGVGLGGFGFALGSGAFLFALRAGGLFVEADELQEFLPPGERFLAARWAGRLESELLGASRSGRTRAAIAAV